MLVGAEQLEQAEAWERVESEGWLALPERFEIHEWDIMRRFVTSVEDPDQRAKLDPAIHGRGAFRIFKHEVREMGLEQDWYAFRGRALEEIAEAWLEEHEVPFIRDRPDTRGHDA